MTEKVWYLYFDIETGNITRISPKKFSNAGNEYICISQNLAKEFQSNRKRLKDYQVVVTSNGYEVSLKSNVSNTGDNSVSQTMLNDLLLSRNLDFIDITKLDNSSRFYLDEGVLKNGLTLSTLTQNNLNLYKTKKDDPTLLYNVVTVDLNQDEQEIDFNLEEDSLLVDVNENLDFASLIGSLNTQVIDKLYNWRLEGSVKRNLLARDLFDSGIIVRKNQEGRIGQIRKQIPVARENETLFRLEATLMTKTATETTFSIRSFKNNEEQKLTETTIRWPNWLYYANRDSHSEIEDLPNGRVKFVLWHKTSDIDMLMPQIWPSGTGEDKTGTIVIEHFKLEEITEDDAPIEINQESEEDPFNGWIKENVSKILPTDNQLLILTEQNRISQIWRDFPATTSEYELAVVANNKDSEYLTLAIRVIDEYGQEESVSEATFRWSDHWIYFGDGTHYASFEQLDEENIMFFVRHQVTGEKKLRCQIWPSGTNINSMGSMVISDVQVKKLRPTLSDYVDLNMNDASKPLYDYLSTWRYEGITKTLTEDNIAINKNPEAEKAQLWRIWKVPESDDEWQLSVILQPETCEQSQFSLKLLDSEYNEVKKSEVCITWPEKWLYYSNEISHAEFEILDEKRILFKVRIKNEECAMIKAQIWPVGYTGAGYGKTGTLRISEPKLEKVEDEQNAD